MIDYKLFNSPLCSGTGVFEFANPKRYWIGAAVGAAASIAGAAIQGAGASASSSKGRKFARWQWQESKEYNDRITREAREYDDPSAVRARIEAAGYNPYLYNGQADSNVGSGSANPMQNNHSATPQSNGLDAFGAGMANAPGHFSDLVSSLSNSKKSDVEADTLAYQLERQKDVDNMKIGGIDGKQRDAELRSQELENAMHATILTRSQSLLSDMKLQFYQKPAYNNEGVPIVDGSGNQLTYGEAFELGIIQNQSALVEKAYQDIENLKTINDINKLEKDIKGYYKTHMQPEEYNILLQQFEKFKSDIRVADAQRNLLDSQNETERKRKKLVQNQSVTESHNASIRQKDNDYYFVNLGGKAVKGVIDVGKSLNDIKRGAAFR